MTWAMYVRQMRLGRGLSQREVARRAGVDPAVISKIESGETIGHADTVARIQSVLGLDPEMVSRLIRRERGVTPSSAVQLSSADLFRQAQVVAEREREELEARARVAEERNLQLESQLKITGDLEIKVTRAGELHTYRIPRVVQTASASPSPGSVVDDEYVELTSQEVPTPAGRIAVTVSGTCMEPEVRHGATVIVDTSQTLDIPDGALVVAVHDDAILAKHLEMRGDERWLVSLNEPPVKANGETRIIGRVLWIEAP